MGIPVKRRRKVVERISCHTIGLCISRFLSEKVYFTGRKEHGDQITPSNSPKAPGHQKPHERSPCAPKFEDKTLQETSVYKLNARDKATFYCPTEWVMPAPSSEKPEERELVEDAGASMHMLNKKDLSSDELDTLRKSRNPTTISTANGEVQTNEEAQVFTILISS